MAARKFVIIGGRGTAVVIAEQLLDAIDRCGMDAEFLGYAFDDETMGGEVNGIPILCKTTEAAERFSKHRDVGFIYQLYRPDLMKERVELLHRLGIPENRLATFIHPTCCVTRSAEIGRGTVLCANTVVNPNAKVGNCVTVNSNVLIGHDTHIGDYTFISGHAAIGSNIRIGQGNFIGLNSAVRNFVTMGDYGLVGAGSNIVKDVESGQVVYGNPGRVREGIGGPVR
jgi:acetyltransferase EpsM